MKILNFTINDYYTPQFNVVRKSKECKNLPIFKKVPEGYFGFYFLKSTYESQDLYELKQRLID